MKASKIFSILFLFFYFGTASYAVEVGWTRVTKLFFTAEAKDRIKVILDCNKCVTTCGNYVNFYPADFPNVADFMKSAMLNSSLTGKKINFYYGASCRVIALEY